MRKRKRSKSLAAKSKNANQTESSCPDLGTRQRRGISTKYICPLQTSGFLKQFHF